jgi:hypothetical protein
MPRDNQPIIDTPEEGAAADQKVTTIEIGAVEVALALSGVAAIMMQLGPEPSPSFLLTLEAVTFLCSGFTAVGLSFVYVAGRVIDVASEMSIFRTLRMRLSTEYFSGFLAGIATGAYTAFMFALIFFYLSLGIWVGFHLGWIELSP